MDSKKHPDLFNRLIFIGGSPRSGTTYAARSLSLHPKIVTAIDDFQYECWALYYYQGRIGLIQDLRTGKPGMDSQKARDILWKYLVENDCLKSIAPSGKSKGYPLSPSIEPLTPDTVLSVRNINLERHIFPLEQFSTQWYLCLKSPELSFTSLQLAELFPQSKFIWVFRPFIEIAESMYRMGSRVKRFPIFYERWKQETDINGRFVPPPGIPDEWAEPWQKATDFQRCVIMAAAYIRAILEAIPYLPPHRWIIYNHKHLREHPDGVFQKLADFLDVEAEGFNEAITRLDTVLPPVDSNLIREYGEIEEKLRLNLLETKIKSQAI